MKNYIFTAFIALSCFATASEEKQQLTALGMATAHQSRETKTDLQVLAEITAAHKARQEALDRATVFAQAGEETLKEKDGTLTGEVEAARDDATALEKAKRLAEAKAAEREENHKKEKEYYEEYWKRKRCRDGCRNGCWGSISTCCCSDFCWDECERKDQEKYLKASNISKEKPKQKGCCPWAKMKR